MEQLEDRSLLATISLGPSGFHVAEGGTATLQATLSQMQMQPVTVYFRTMPGTAIENTDYTGIPSGSVTIPPGATYANIGVSALNDIDLEGMETFSVELTGASGASINPAAASTQVTIDNVQSGGGGGGAQGYVNVALSLESAVAQNGIDEGAVFELTGSIDLAGYYQISGVIHWGDSASEGGANTSFTVTTNPYAVPHAQFTVYHRYLDDGPDPGNGTPSDEQPITITGTATPLMPGGGGNLSVTGDTSITIHNVSPEPIFDIYNYMPIGGPKWIASGVFQDAGLTDKGTVEIDWGDGSPTYTLSNVPVGTEYSQMHEYPSDGLGYRITITTTDDDTAVVSYHEDIGLFLLDLDNDANNNGEISSLDEGFEPTAPGPGRYISVNADDDNENDIPDMNEPGPISGENDLEPFLVQWRGDMRPDINNYAGWHLLLQVPQEQPDWAFLNPRIWFNPDKSPGPPALDPDGNGQLDLEVLDAQFAGKEWIIGDPEDPIPETLYLEARQTDEIGLQLRLWTPSGELVENDTIVFTAIAADVEVDLIIHHGQRGAAVKAADEEIRGAVTVANLNDTDADSLASEGNHKRDFEDPDGVVKTNDHGRDEVDLMLLKAKRPVGYVVGEPVDLWIMPGDRVRLWQDERKETPYPGYTAGAGLLTLSWAAGVTSPKEIWVEIISKSLGVADIQIDLSYNEKTDTVKATGLWVERTAYERGNVDFPRDTDNDGVADYKNWPDPWKNAPLDIKKLIDIASGGPQGNTIGTGIRNSWVGGNGKTNFHNGILFEFQVYPPNAQTFFADVVKFDVTRQKQVRRWADANPTPYEDLPFPDMWEKPNDDPIPGMGVLFDESLEPDENGKMYSVDAPGIGGGATFVGGRLFTQWNFFEYVRVSLNGVKPDGNELLGSQCSGNYGWHARVAIEKKAAGWERIELGGNKTNDVDTGLITIGATP